MSAHKNDPQDNDNDPKMDLPPQNFEDANLHPHLDKQTTPDNRENGEIEKLKRELETANKKAEENWERLLRKEAELQNIQKRAQQDIENTRKFAIERFAGELVQVLDSLEHGINFASDAKEHTMKEILEGIKMTHTILLNIFEKENITILDPIGEPFNPHFHEALSTQETSDVKPNTVLMVIQKGYMLNQRLIRPARVIVSKLPAENKDE